MRRRRGDCQHGTYQHEGNTCCLCPSGYHVISDCTDNRNTECEICQSGLFAMHPNNDHSCRHCKVCHSEVVNMEVKENCSIYSDTVCRCQKDHYCDKGYLCRACYPCDMCEEEGGVKIPCTFTNNTVCNGAKESNGAVIAAILVSLCLIIVGLVIVLFLWKKQMFCFKDRKTEDPKLKKLLEVRKDIDLNQYLHEVASILPSKLMKDVARRTGMAGPDIEQHEINHPKDVKEQTYRLLEDWSQAQGLNDAYPTLIKTLLELKAKTTADQIIKIVERGEATA